MLVPASSPLALLVAAIDERRGRKWAVVECVLTWASLSAIVIYR